MNPLTHLVLGYEHEQYILGWYHAGDSHASRRTVRGNEHVRLWREKFRLSLVRQGRKICYHRYLEIIYVVLNQKYALTPFFCI